MDGTMQGGEERMHRTMHRAMWGTMWSARGAKDAP